MAGFESICLTQIGVRRKAQGSARSALQNRQKRTAQRLRAITERLPLDFDFWLYYKAIENFDSFLPRVFSSPLCVDTEGSDEKGVALFKE